VASDSDELRIGYISLEAVSKQLAEKINFTDEARILAEWSYPRSVFEPWAMEEKRRVGHLLKLVLEDQVLPDRWAVGDEGEQIRVNPDGDRPWWGCIYCSHRTLCSAIGPGEPSLPLAGFPLPQEVAVQ
jgi:hypothetical protein